MGTLVTIPVARCVSHRSMSSRSPDQAAYFHFETALAAHRARMGDPKSIIGFLR